MTRKILVVLAVVLALLVGAVLLLPLLLDREKILAIAAGTLKEQTGIILTVDGDIDLHLLPSAGLAVTEAALTLPGKEQPDLRIGALSIGVKLLPLLTGAVEIAAFTVDGLTARVETAAQEPALDTSQLSDAELDAIYAERRQAMAAAGDAGAAQAALAPLALNVASLRVTDARVELVDPASATTVIELPRLEASDLNLDGRPSPLELVLRLPGEQPVEVTLAGRVGVDRVSQLATLDQVTAEIAGVTAQVLQLVLEGEVDIAAQVADLAIQIELGETRGAGSLRYASLESPQIAADLQLNLFDPVLFALAGPDAVAGGTDKPAPSGDDPLPLDALRAVDTEAKLVIDQARFDAHVIEDLNLRLRVVEGVATLSDITGSLHGGDLQAAATFDGRYNTATLATRGRLDGLDLASALAATGSQPTLRGKASLDWQLQGAGGTANELTAALAGPVTLDTEAVTLVGTSVEKMLCQAVALTNKERLTAPFQPDTTFQTLDATVNITGGKAVLSPLRADLTGIALRGNGQFDLLSKDFSATFTAQMSEELEQLDHACRLSKRLVGIDWPVNCRGNAAQDPDSWCKVDTESIVREMATGEAQRVIKKEAGKLLQKFFGN